MGCGIINNCHPFQMNNLDNFSSIILIYFLYSFCNFMPRAKSSFRQMVKGFQENNK